MKHDQDEDQRSAVEKILTCLAYRPKTRTWDETIMADVRELTRMRLAGETLPDDDKLGEWRREQSQNRRASPGIG